MTPMDARPFAVEQLISARYGIEQAMREMPALRQAVAEKMKEDIEAARPYHSALRKSKIDLVEALDSAGSALEEMEEFKLARGARILRDSVSSFKLMAVSYSKLLQVLNQFCNMLPNDEGTVGRALGRLTNHAKMGYFPTDLTHIGYLHEALDFPECCVNLLDPCCGEGYALKALAPSVNSVTYGVELSNERAEAACERLARVAMGDFFRCRISRGVFHVLFLNPPYLAIPGENVRVREEKRFLIESLPCLMQGGTLIYIVPYYRVTPGIARCLCDHLTDISVYRFEGKEFERFRQIVLIGKRTRSRNGAREAVRLYKQCELGPDLPGLSEIGTARYTIPNTESSVEVFCGSIFNELELYRQMSQSGSVRELFGKENELDRLDKRPMLPLNAGQIGLIGGSGMLDGLVDCDVPHVIRGMIAKDVITDEHPIEFRKDKSVKRILQTNTVTNRLTFHLLTPDGYKRLY